MFKDLLHSRSFNDAPERLKMHIHLPTILNNEDATTNNKRVQGGGYL